jgi:hypothetical protein
MAITPMQVRYNELLGFFQSWVPTYGQCDFFLYGQAAPRQNKPYVTANIMSNVEMVGTVERRKDPITGAEKLRTQLNVVCDLFAFTNSSDRYTTAVEENTAWAIMQELKTSLRYPVVYDMLTAITCRLLTEDTVVDTTQLLSTTFEPQATCSITFSTVVGVAIDNGEIATINAEGTMDATNNDKIIDVSVTE